MAGDREVWIRHATEMRDRARSLEQLADWHVRRGEAAHARDCRFGANAILALLAADGPPPALTIQRLPTA